MVQWIATAGVKYEHFGSKTRIYNQVWIDHMALSCNLFHKVDIFSNAIQ